jgi:hypothetical protein
VSVLAYDAARNRTVLVGWSTVTVYKGNDTWEWDGNTWSQKNPTLGLPVTMNATSLAYDPRRQRIICREASLSGTWEWDGVNWTPIATAPTPSGGPIVYDEARGAVLALTAGGQTWHYGNLVPAASAPQGTACLGSNGLPILSCGTPRLGDQGFVVDLLSARANAPCGIGLATATQSLNLGGGCSLYLSGALVVLAATSNASGFASVGLTIPFDPALQGAVVHGQAVVADPGGAIPGAAFTGGLKITLGW